VLSALLRQRGIESVVLESRSRSYVEQRVRAGVLEHGSVETLDALGVSERLHREGLVHHGINLRFDGENHYLNMTALTGRSITVYGQQEVVKDLIASGLPVRFETKVERVDPVRGVIHHGGGELRCDVIAGCDGFHGVCRGAIPAGVLTEFAREYPFGWLGILARVAPASDELVYAWNPEGFALLSMRTPEISRLYLQCRPDEAIADWPDERIWSELRPRLGLDPDYGGEIFEKGVTPMRSFVVEPMQYERLFLAGDAAHIVPPTGAKGMNLAIHDVTVLADAIASGDTSGYSEACLRRVWRAEHFSWWMTSMLHRFPDDDAFGARLQLAQLRYTVGSRFASTSLAENYVGLERA
jgi:p-hydroxybenzoate 3-monooxygenase